MIQLLADLLIAKSKAREADAFDRGKKAGISDAICSAMRRMSAEEIATAEKLADQEVSRA